MSAGNRSGDTDSRRAVDKPTAPLSPACLKRQRVEAARNTLVMEKANICVGLYLKMSLLGWDKRKEYRKLVMINVCRW